MLAETTTSSLAFAALLSFFVTFWAFKKGYFRLREKEIPILIPITYPLYAFLVYFFASLFVGALLLLSFKTLKETNEGVALYQLFTIFGVFVFFVVYLLSLNRTSIKYIFTGKPNAPHIFVSFFKNVKMGVLTYLISYPVVLFTSLLIEFITKHFWGEKEVNQVAVEQLKKTFELPWLFIALSLTIAFVVPFIEELLFRGFLQTYLRDRIGRKSSLFCTAILFALFHYSSKQGFGNIELIISLFVLACYLGFIYERQRSLWASYGLHMTFNAISIIALKLQS